MEIKIGDTVKITGTNPDIADYYDKIGTVKEVRIDLEYPIYITFKRGVFEDEDEGVVDESFKESELVVCT
jgi:hypothetical protein